MRHRARRSLTPRPGSWALITKIESDLKEVRALISAE
jgi:hypothetical protein